MSCPHMINNYIDVKFGGQSYGSVTISITAGCVLFSHSPTFYGSVVSWIIHSTSVFDNGQHDTYVVQ